MIEIYLAFFLAFVYIWRKRAKAEANLPPGPWLKLPIVGHLPFLGSNPHVVLTEWTSKYGPIISVQLGSFPAVIINNGKLLKQAFSTSALAGRPRIKVFDAWSRRKGLAFCDGPHALEQRRFSLRTLKDLNKTSDSKEMEEQVLEQAVDLISRLDASKGKPMSVRHFFNRNVINSLLGFLISEKFGPDDPKLAKISYCLTSSFQNNGLLPVLGMYVPFLCTVFPEAMGYNAWLNTGNELRDFFRPYIKEHLATLIPGQPRDILDMYMEKLIDSKDDPTSTFHDVGEIEDMFREYLTGGMETTANTLEWIVHYMAKYPSVQEKLIAELDLELPNKRPPSLNDRPNLPYTEAFIQEALRISSVVPFALFHSALEDTEVAGYKIPKDTLVIGNQYAVNNDPAVWENPKEFRPERFINGDGKYASGDNPVLAFGTGRRSCTGEGLGRNELFLFTVRMFQNFRVKGASELSGNHNFSMTVSPEPFKIIFERRNQSEAI